MRCLIECPVKTMNIAHETSDPAHHPAGTWQTDTGPIALPDVTLRFARPSDAIALGFTAINNLQPNNADFVSEVLLAVPGGEGVKTMHFGSPHSVKATNRIICVPPPP